MDINFFKETRVLDGGMGQELLARGVESNGTLWSANALLQEKYHQLLLDTHLDFINSGAEIIVTTTFTTRRMRLRDNGVEDKFEYLNTKAGEIAKKAKDLNPHVLVAGGLPPQYLTYEADTRSDNEIKENFYDQARLLDPFIDFFYFDVLSSVREFKLGIGAIKSFNKPYLIGAHVSEGVKLPSGENISEIITTINHKNLLGIILSCVSPENYEKNLNEIKSLDVPFGFKLNGFITTKPTAGYTNTFNKSKTGNPNEFLGHREDLMPEKMALFVKKFKEAGATILGGCCETRPAHIKEMSKLK
ncbi:homocysteine S-methyltransferase family protein [Candidatus Pelagibacter sp.]|jgi:homocysteine S-methyltransferase|nr:homocysteine S-methyltransferase family protein [Candidatus Pelagibacter sp.]